MQEPDFHGAAIVDAEGKETAITEDMVKQALDALMRAETTTESVNQRSRLVS